MLMPRKAVHREIMMMEAFQDKLLHVAIIKDINNGAHTILLAVDPLGAGACCR
jgi:hypothetical protein